MGNKIPEMGTGKINRVVKGRKSEKEFSDRLNELAGERVTVFFLVENGTTTVRALNVPDEMVQEAIEWYEATH